MSILLVLAVAVLSHQATAQVPEVDVELVPEVATLRPGTVFRVGVRLRIPEGWHIYWTNPGQSGLPTTLEWRGPTEIEHRATEWPVPVREDSSGIVSHVYRGDVAFVSTFRVAPSASAGTVNLVATLAWAICREICVPQRRDVSVSVPLRAMVVQASQPWPAFYAAAKPRLPAAPNGVTVRAVARDDGVDLMIRARDGMRTVSQSATFFPEERGAAAVVLKPRSVSGTTVFQVPDPPKQPSRVARLRGVLLLEPGRALVLDVPVERP